MRGQGGDNILIAYSKIIKKRLVDYELSITAFADNLGYTREYITQVINNKRKANNTLAKKISKELGGTIDDFFSEKVH